MERSEFKAFAGILAGYCEIYGHKLSDMQGALWFDSLARYSLDQVQAAFKRHVTNPESGRFMPKPADLILAIDGLPGDRAELAWSRVAAAIDCYGPTSSVRFEDGVAASVVRDMGGWIKVARTTTKDMPFLQREFCRRYSALYAIGGLQPPDTLPGVYEIDNLARGFDPQPAVFVSFPASTRPQLLGGSAKTSLGAGA